MPSYVDTRRQVLWLIFCDMCGVDCGGPEHQIAFLVCLLRLVGFFEAVSCRTYLADRSDLVLIDLSNFMVAVIHCILGSSSIQDIA
jgi:hypothetical protein